MGSFKFNLIISNVWCQIVLVSNCPVPNCPGAKLSWCQIVHFYYLVAKLSPLLSWCQIVRCKIVLQSKSGTIFFISNIYIPKMKNKKKPSFILMKTQIGFNLKCIAQCICSKLSGLTFLDNVQKLSSFHTQICSKMQFWVLFNYWQLH